MDVFSGILDSLEPGLGNVGNVLKCKILGPTSSISEFRVQPQSPAIPKCCYLYTIDNINY